MAAVALQIQSFGHPFFSEDMMTSPYAFDESQSQQQGAQLVKSDIRLRAAFENSLAKS